MHFQQLMHLQQALQALQRERTVQGKRQAELLQASADEARKQAQWAVEAAEKEWKQQINDLKERLVVSEQRCQDEALFRRKAEIDLNAEKRQMQKVLIHVVDVRYRRNLSIYPIDTRN